MMKKLLGITIFLFSVITSAAQQGTIKAYSDQQVYIAGEKIWIAGMKSGNPGENDNPVGVYLIDRSGNIVERVNVLDTEGKISCNIQLGGDMDSDNYLIVINSKGFEPFYLAVAVINPVVPPRNAVNHTGVYRNISVPVLDVKTDKGEYLKREAVKVSLQAQKDMELHVSVIRKDDLSVYVDSLLSTWNKPELEIMDHTPAGEGQQLKLLVYDADNQLAPGVRLFASVLGDQANIATAVSDAEGAAQISIPYIYGNASLVLSASHENGQSYKVVYEEPQLQVRGDMGLPSLQLDERFRTSINERLLNTEITNKYRAEAKIRYVTTGLDTTDFYGKPDKRYMLDDYTRIPNMEEILYEYVLEARARKLGGRSVIYVFNTPFKSFFELPAMVLLDGVPVSDIDQLLGLDPLQLRSVDVVAKKFLIDDLQIPGIIQYKSYKADLAGYKLPLQDMVYAIKGNAIPVEPVFAEYEKMNDERLPDMRNLLYWTPFHSAGTENWTFYTPDVDGNYTILVRGLDKQGSEYKGEIDIRVK